MAVSVCPGVKVARVVLVIQLGHKAHLLPQKGIPVESAEERMGLDVGRSASATDSSGAQPITGVLLEKSRDQVLGLGRNRPVIVARPFDVVVDDVSEELLRRLSEKGDATDEELVEDDPGCPPIHRLAC